MLSAEGTLWLARIAIAAQRYRRRLSTSATAPQAYRLVCFALLPRLSAYRLRLRFRRRADTIAPILGMNTYRDARRRRLLASAAIA